MRLRDKVVLVTGASRGIGAAVALAAAQKGAHLALIARTASDLEDVRAKLGGRSACAVADVADADAVRDGVATLEAELGPVDVLVANAGIGAYGPFADITTDEMDRVVRVNVLGAMYVIRAVLPGMISRRQGHVVTMGSIAGRLGSPFEAVYSASKFAVVGLTEAISVEARPYGVHVSMVNPGPVATDFGEARGHPYDRKSPKPVSAEAVAGEVIRAIEQERHELYVPKWFRPAVVVRHVLPPLFHRGTVRTFRDELASDAKRR